MSPWDGASRWINTILLVLVGFIGFDTLFRLLDANEQNVIVGFTRSVAEVFLAPFQGMFDDQEYLLTALIAVLGYALLAGIALAVVRAAQASARRRALRRPGPVPPGHIPSAGTGSDSTQPTPRDDTEQMRPDDTQPPRPPRNGAPTGELPRQDPPAR